jgi:hypothetical protein
MTSNGMLALPVQSLAQSPGGFDAILGYFFSVLGTPLGISLFVLGVLGVALALLSKHSVELLACAAMFMLSTMFDARENAVSVNILWGPLEQLRAVSRPVALGLAVLATGLVLTIPIGIRRSSTGLAALALLLFQWYHAFHIMLFENTVKGALAVVSTICMFAICAIGFGRRLQDARSTARTVEWFAVLGAAFVATNLFQLVVGPSAMVLSGRLVGIAGNAQQMAAVSSMLLLLNVFVGGDRDASRTMRWIAITNAVFLSTFVIWSGSRTGTLTCLLGILFMYRMRVRRLALVAGGLAVAVLVLWSVLGADTAAAERLVTGSNTRGEVFEMALEQFSRNPLIGGMPFGEGSGVESSFLRALALHGIVGGILVTMPFLIMGFNALSAYRLGRHDPAYTRLADLFVGMTIAILAVNNLEGFAFGVLTLPAMIMYFALTLGAFLSEQAALDTSRAAGDDGPVAEEWAGRWA